MTLPESLRPHVSRLGGRFSFAVHHLGTGERLGHEVDARYPAASLIKVPVLATLLASGDAGHLDPSEAIVLREADKVGDEGLLHLEATGTLWTLSRLMELMIVVSDNTATNMLIDRMGGFEPFNAYFPELGLTTTRLDRRMIDWEARQAGRENWTTPAEMFEMMSRLARKELVDARISRQIIRIMLGQQDREKLPARLPPEFPVASKPGELPGGVRHDMGIVFSHTGPCVMVLMSDQTNEAAADEALADIAAELFAEVGGEAYAG